MLLEGKFLVFLNFPLITWVTQVSKLFSHFWQLVCATLSTIVQHGSHVCSTCVCPLVGGEVIRAGEDLAAHSAAVGLVAGVEPHVPGEHVAPSECSLTNLTEVSSAPNTNTRVSGARLTTLTVNRRVRVHEKLNWTL